MQVYARGWVSREHGGALREHWGVASEQKEA